MKVIDLGDGVAQKIIVTNSWGFIVAHIKKKHNDYLYLFNINGIEINHVQITSSVSKFISWSSSSGFDYIGYLSDENYLYGFETYYLNVKLIKRDLPNGIISFNYSTKLNKFIIVNKDGNVNLISYKPDESYQ